MHQVSKYLKLINPATMIQQNIPYLDKHSFITTWKAKLEFRILRLLNDRIQQNEESQP